MPEFPVKKRGRIRTMFALVPMAARGAFKVARRLPKEKRQELVAVAKDPEEWNKAVSSGWDTAKVEAIEAKDAFTTMAKIVIGRKTSRTERKQAADQLGLLGTVVPPLRVFMIPGSEVLLSIAAFGVPWKLVPNKWIPFKSLRDNPEEEVETQKRKRFKLFNKDRQTIVDKLD